MARSRGYALVKSRSRTPEDYIFGTYGLIDPDGDYWVTHDSVGRGYGWSLAEIVETYLGS